MYIEECHLQGVIQEENNICKLQELAAVRKQLAKNNKMKKSKASKEHSNVNGGADVVHTGTTEKDVDMIKKLSDEAMDSSE